MEGNTDKIARYLFFCSYALKNLNFPSKYMKQRESKIMYVCMHTCEQILYLCLIAFLY